MEPQAEAVESPAESVTSDSQPSAETPVEVAPETRDQVQAESAPEPAEAASPAEEPAATEAVETPRAVELPEAPPPAEKKTGWWRRAKATFSGN
jgi:hypothetical protein